MSPAALPLCSACLGAIGGACGGPDVPFRAAATGEPCGAADHEPRATRYAVRSSLMTRFVDGIGAAIREALRVSLTEHRAEVLLDGEFVAAYVDGAPLPVEPTGRLQLCGGAA